MLERVFNQPPDLKQPSISSDEAEYIRANCKGYPLFIEGAIRAIRIGGLTFEQVIAELNAEPDIDGFTSQMVNIVTTFFQEHGQRFDIELSNVLLEGIEPSSEV